MNKTPDYKLIIAELKEDPFRSLNIAFALMSMIPLLIILYLLATDHNTYSILIGTKGFLFLVAILFTILGFSTSYTLIRKVIYKMLHYSDECRKSEELKSALVSEVSHDFRTPLTTIRVSVESLIGGGIGNVSAVQAKMLNICLSTVERLTQFVNTILTIPRIKLTKVGLKREELDFNLLIDKELQIVEPLIRQKQQNISYKKERQVLEMWGDNLKLQQVVANLLSNAVKYAPIHGSINITTAATGDVVELKVANTGEGIPPNRIAEIFNKYYRVKEASDKEGFGLGLSIVKEIIELHRGRIDVFSEIGKETRFSVLLPRDLRDKPRRMVTV
ncbi:MAG: HAMP domain-containing sensor histidine kinase [Candidatus Orphnella occulta]|nr:HAMP domain-containing sensor histidine kinase [Candidatus Orphnella occulta]